MEIPLVVPMVFWRRQDYESAMPDDLACTVAEEFEMARASKALKA
jgi:hypothetical protein